MREILYGRNVARECLRGRRRHIHTVLLAENIDSSPIISEIQKLAAGLRIPVQIVGRKKLDKLARGHQGVVLEVGRYPIVSPDEILARATRQNEPPFLIAIDHLEDPHNLGAILRTAEIVGVHGIILPRRRAAGVTPAVVSASAGAAEHMLVAEVPNLVQAMNSLKQANVWLAGLENRPEALLYSEADLGGAIALVVGSEGQGMGRLVRETCDFLVKLPMRGQIESLNAAVACGLIMYEAWRARGFLK